MRVASWLFTERCVAPQEDEIERNRERQDHGEKLKKLAQRKMNLYGELCDYFKPSARTALLLWFD